MQHHARMIILVIVTLAVTVTSMVVMSPQKTEASFAECAGAALSSIGLSAAANVVNVGTISPTADSITGSATAKECILDGIAIAIREALIRKITSATVEWINGGFQGSPAFVTNIESFLTDTADEAFGDFIYRETNFAFLCSNLQFDIRFSLALSYAGRQSRPTCRLSDIVDNVETAIVDLSTTWDWDVYQTVTTDPGSNPFMGMIQLSEDAQNLIDERKQEQLDDINRGGGFLSFKHCRDAGDNNEYTKSDGSTGNSTLANRSLSSSVGGGTGGRDCQIATPGTIIRQGLSDNLNGDLERLTLADEFDEIVGALMGQLFKQVFSGEGLTGVSQRSGSSRSFLNEYRQDSEDSSGESAGDLQASIQRYKTNAQSYSGIEAEKKARLLEARIQVESAFGCYETKYNTWINQSGNVIPPNQVNSTPESSRTRATFAYLTNDPPAGSIYGGTVLDQTRILLPSSLSLQKVKDIGTILARIDSDIADADTNIADATVVIAKADEYLKRFSDTNEPSQNLAVFQEFSREIPDVTVELSMAQSSLQSTISFIEGILLGEQVYTAGQPSREGGVVEELQTCQLFNQIYTGNPGTSD